MVAIQHVNSETGVSQPIADYAPVVRDAGGILLVDCAQSAGKFALPDADMLVVSAHKFGGPPGIGALLLRDFGLLEASGGQEFGYRGGTENLPAALGFAAALEAQPFSNGEADWLAGLECSILALEDAIRGAGGERVGSGARKPAILAIAMPRMKAAAQLVRFDAMGFAVSAGSACSSGTLKPSRVLQAFGVDPDVAARTIRVSFGWNTTAAEIDAFLHAWLAIAADAKARAA